MTNGESIVDFLSRAMAIVSQMCTYGEKILDETIVTTIEEAKDLSIISIDELMGSLHAHESRINRSSRGMKKRLYKQRRQPTTKAMKEKNIHLASRSRGRGEFRSFHGGHDNRSRWRNDGQR